MLEPDQHIDGRTLYRAAGGREMAAGFAFDVWSLEPSGRRGIPALQHMALAVVSRFMAVLLLVLLSPLMLLIAALVWLSDGGPILFGHLRVGRHGKFFRCWKFRTMASDADQRLKRLLEHDEDARVQWHQRGKLNTDPRITRLGSFLRKSSLDELPQLLNVICGEMGFVGPRPITYDELHRYAGDRWYYLSVVPGITGLWQVSGRNELTYDQRIMMDRRYVESRSLMGDMRILIRTVGVVLGQKGGY